jgi:signal transduction histidine kinase
MNHHASFFRSPALNESRLGASAQSNAGLKKKNELLSRRNSELKFLCRASQIFASTPQLIQSSEFIDVLQELTLLMDVSWVLIWLVDEESAELACTHSVGARHKSFNLTPQMFDTKVVRWVYQYGISLIVPTLFFGKLSQRHSFPTSNESNHPKQSAVFIPIQGKDTVLGVLQLSLDEERGHFTASDKSFVESLATSIATAIANERLNVEAQALASQQERQHLAAELHDALNQSLFTANLIAEVLPHLWEKDIDEGRRSLTHLHSLVRGAAAELRGVLGGLCPNTLAETDLVVLIHQLSDAFTGRTTVPVSIEVSGEGDILLPVQETFYKLCNEMLTNIAKHAKASQVEIQLRHEDEGVELRVMDNGCGFDPEQVSEGHYGLDFMYKRAKAIDATLVISSADGQGTDISVWWRAKMQR